MLARSEVQDIVNAYEKDKIKIGMIASHSALDACDGAVEEGFPTLAVCQKGRDNAYDRYFKAQRDEAGRVIRGMVDECWITLQARPMCCLRSLRQ